MWWSNLFTDMSPASFFNFSFLPKYAVFFIQGVEYTLLLAVVSVLLAVFPALPEPGLQRWFPEWLARLLCRRH